MDSEILKYVEPQFVASCDDAIMLSWLTSLHLSASTSASAAAVTAKAILIRILLKQSCEASALQLIKGVTGWQQ